MPAVQAPELTDRDLEDPKLALLNLIIQQLILQVNQLTVAVKALGGNIS